MKRKYSKPQLAAESFQLNASVASCSSSSKFAIHFDQDTCVYGDEPDKGEVYIGYFVFSGYNTDCEYYPGGANGVGEGPGQKEKTCYHGPLTIDDFMLS